MFRFIGDLKKIPEILTSKLPSTMKSTVENEVNHVVKYSEYFVFYYPLSFYPSSSF